MWFVKLLSDKEPLSPQAATGCLVSTGAFFVWAAVTLFLAVTGKAFAYYDAMTTGAFGMFSSGAGLLGWHLHKNRKGGGKKNDG